MAAPRCWEARGALVRGSAGASLREASMSIPPATSGAHSAREEASEGTEYAPLPTGGVCPAWVRAGTPRAASANFPAGCPQQFCWLSLGCVMAEPAIRLALPTSALAPQETCMSSILMVSPQLHSEPLTTRCERLITSIYDQRSPRSPRSPQATRTSLVHSERGYLTSLYTSDCNCQHITPKIR